MWELDGVFAAHHRDVVRLHLVEVYWNGIQVLGKLLQYNLEQPAPSFRLLY